MRPWDNAFDWSEIGEQAVSDLQSLLRIDTSNPPGDESQAAAFVADSLRADGLEPEVLEAAPKRLNVISRIQGTDDSLAPLLLSAHLDVVPAKEEGWTHPPFAGERRDGFVWGRGAIDMKNMAVMCMWMMKLRKRLEKPPRRTLIFAAVADEELGCTYGSRWLVENHPDKIRAGAMLSEVGGFTLYLQGKRFYPIQVAEKGQAVIQVRTRGQKGHGSIPRPDSASTKLAEAITRIGSQRLPRHITPVQENFIREAARHLPFPFKHIFPQILSRRLGDTLLDRLPVEQSAPLRANMHNTVTVTVVQAGEDGSRNVVPGEATAILDGRILPGQSAQDLLREVREIVGDGPELEVLESQPPPPLEDYNTDLFHLICRTVKERDPTGVPIPYMVPGFTDAQFYHRLGIQCYGFSPLQLPPEIAFSDLFHGVNERISVKGFLWGLRTLADVVLSYTS